MKPDDGRLLLRLDVPGAAADTDTDTEPLADAAGVLSPLARSRVMMLDDEPLMTDLIQTWLEDEGYADFVALHDPRQALEVLRREQPDLLLLDLMMPDVSGYDVLAAVRADESLRLLPVIVLTAATGADARLRALRLGATDFLSKPVDASELVLRVRNTLAFRQVHERLLHHDAVTGLANERLLRRWLVDALESPSAVSRRATLMLVALPECRQLHDALDDSTADALAQAMTRRLDHFADDLSRQLPAPEAAGGPASRAALATPRVARLAADRFALLLGPMADTAAAEDLARRLLQALAAPLPVLGDLVATPSVGIALAPDDGHLAETLLRSAELALARAQRAGALHVGWASPALNATAQQRGLLGRQLRGAAQRGELLLHYQPKVAVADGRIVGVEALVRWRHPERGLVPPGEFIPLAEELGLIGGIGRWVLERACHDAAAWSRDGLGALSVAVNVSRPQVFEGDILSTVRQALFDSGLPASRLVIELTESLLIEDVDAGRRAMHALKGLGLALSIDDFGTGYSSLSYLKTFPLDELKIDRSFIADLPGGSADTAIVAAIIGLGHTLGMQVTAEGVETQAQLLSLRALGCDRFQGFLRSRPLPEADLRVLLAQQAPPAD